jgi:hypothetical protein
VSSAVEKSASPQPPRPGKTAFLPLCLAVACSFVVIPQGSAVELAVASKAPGKIERFRFFRKALPAVPKASAKPEAHAIEFKFLEFSPKNACQVPKPSKSFKQSRIELAF